MKKNNLDLYKDAYKKNIKFYDENNLMLSWYSKRMIETIKDKHYGSLISLGIGHKIVSKKILKELGNLLKRYIIIEGSERLIKWFMKNIKLPSNVTIINSLFEDYEAKEKVDAIEMGFILEHVNDPPALINRYSKFLKPDGSFFIAVPNAKSLHRQIGHNAKLLDSLKRLSRYDLKLGHKRYFDLESIVKLVLESGLKIVNIEGIFLKPFSTSQLRSLKLLPEVVNALCYVGVDYPDISNAIYIQATL